ncbi:ubiquitin carboxyl-terminal hydrolase 10 [Dendroctonus ponderosae]|uniref:ubiquitinyl hydrolase 1 n=1 Tax=Dendroctonus ponderosae TaxID=77166 RepID=U4UBZ6_DENPD|nr:ubiquitin carboxyl-terminal hydrolase 10 [Dendroctonus ponderosae]ERL87470.1 hypothetical protein D910_04862 [Dendroctonus ponderosae]
MDTPDNIGLQFLDLTGIEEYEKNAVLTSLQPLQPDARFPWYIGGNPTNEGSSWTKLAAEFVPQPLNETYSNATEPISIINPENGFADEPFTDPALNSIAHPPINSPYNSSQYYLPPIPPIQSPSVHLPGSYGYNHFSPTGNHPDLPVTNAVYTPYPNYPAKVFYEVPSAQPTFINHGADAGIYYPHAGQMYLDNSIPVQPEIAPSSHWESPTSIAPTQNGTALKKSPPLLSADTPAFTPKNQQPDQEKAAERPDEPKSSAEATVEAPQSAPLEEKSVSTPNQASGAKSWASLFTPKGGSASAMVNGTSASASSAAKQLKTVESCPIKNPRKNHFIDPDCYRMGEFLKNCSVDGRAISLQPRGLINQSNYCYINSILQALLACPPMYNLLSGLADNISSNVKRKPTPVIDGMCKFIKEYNHLPANMRVNNRRSDGGKKDQKRDQNTMINTDIPFEPSWVYKILSGLQTDLIEGRQEDAEEFLGCLLNHLSDEMLELIKLVETSERVLEEEPQDDSDMWQVMGNKNKGSVLRKMEFERTPITDIFGGSLKSRIYRTGGLVTENTQPFLTLPLNIEKVKTVREALDALTTKHQLEGLTSAKTNEEVEAWQQVMLDELPVILILHLKCFDFQLNGCTKIVKALEFPIDLKIDGKLLSQKTTNAKVKQYKLFAIVYHDGKEATKGHYVTDAFHVGFSSWLRYDDASVKPVQEEQVLNPQGTRVPYLLFYRRSDTIRSK